MLHVEKAARSVKYKHKKFAGYDSKGRKRWRYFYDDPKGGGVKGGKEQEALSASVSVGDVFKSGDGHIKMLMVASDGRITYEDADGKKVNTTEEKLRSKLLSEHKESIVDALESGLMKRQQILDAAKKHGTPKQIERAEKNLSDWSKTLRLRGGDSTPSPAVSPTKAKAATFADVAKERGYKAVAGQGGLFEMDKSPEFKGKIYPLFKAEGRHETHPDAYKDSPYEEITDGELQDALESLRAQYKQSVRTKSARRFGNLEAEAALGYLRPRAEKAILRASTVYTNGDSLNEAVNLTKDPSLFDSKKFANYHRKGVFGVGDYAIPLEEATPETLIASLALVKRLAKTMQGEKRTLHRGISLTKDAARAFIEQMEKGDAIDLRGVSSWSSSPQVAERFSRQQGHQSIVFEVETDRGLRLEEVSMYPEEFETVLTGSLVMKSVTKGEDGIYRVRCAHVNAEK